MLITFVTEAGLNCSCSFFEYKTLPVDCSIKIAYSDSRLRLSVFSVLSTSELETFVVLDQTYTVSVSYTHL